ncbi:MAG: hypothetical protein BroJett011_10390 [Chloroflexota bacterium]|nr:MAG: hypothetical protein BroJett011_10390 [Chloroflexota bacterium]
MAEADLNADRAQTAADVIQQVRAFSPGCGWWFGLAQTAADVIQQVRAAIGRVRP